MNETSLDQNGLWIFGYGSLIWRTEFPFAESRPAWINGWSRRFWQGSTDHRGVPGAPGRVVTLVEDPGAICWGRAYRLDPRLEDKVMAQLDYREKGGYERDQVALHFSRTESLIGTLYHATADNENYLGDADISLIAKQVLQAHGPSGPNTEYVLQLHAALAELGAEDEHVNELVSAMRQLMQEADAWSATSASRA